MGVPLIVARQPCPVCSHGESRHFANVKEARFNECLSCGSLFVDPETMARAFSGELRPYDKTYWSEELKAARERSYGSTLTRVGEVFLYARRPIKKFLDISCGGGALLDAISEVAPEISSLFYGIEPFPPPEEFVTNQPGFRKGFVHDLEDFFDAGICIEVIEHLTPAILESLVSSLASRSRQGALYYFNSAQPSFVKKHDPGYLDPFNRGHVVSYSLKGIKRIFERHRFNVLPIPGRDFGFLAEFNSDASAEPNDVMNRIWTPVPENLGALRSARFGSLLHSSAVEAAQMYFYQSMLNKRPA